MCVHFMKAVKPQKDDTHKCSQQSFSHIRHELNKWPLCVSFYPWRVLRGLISGKESESDAICFSYFCFASLFPTVVKEESTFSTGACTQTAWTFFFLLLDHQAFFFL